MQNKTQLTHLFPMHSFFTSWIYQKTARFSDVFRGTERVHWELMGQKRNRSMQLLKVYKIPTIHRTKGSFQLLSYLMILLLRTLKTGKCQVVLAKLWWNILEVQKTKDVKSYIIQTVKQKYDIILYTGTNDLKNIETPEEITMGILSLAMTCKTDTTASQDLTSLIRKLENYTAS